MLSGDLEARIRELKAKPGGELQVHGSGQLIRWLLERELVDELTLIVCAGTRLFPDEGKDFALELLESRRFPTGILAQTYRPNGRPRYA
ncbi:dihydrofolate reductase family protein [Agromyces sp. H66]|uniref:dihydrofolate reductase family protein n=1 Tax=Agromyces sp. H66 TaxID=2529859 RepID=UPI0020C16C96|nr:dihydrofolate reductase family protein [Agromyces sp. H66]